MYQKIIELARKRIATFEAGDRPDFYKGYATYVHQLREEIEEMVEEIGENNSVYLEDELGDVFWVYVCLLESLKAEGKITSIDKVFERSYKKFSERISPETGKNNREWGETKKIQKAELKKEHEEKYGKK